MDAYSTRGCLDRCDELIRRITPLLTAAIEKDGSAAWRAARRMIRLSQELEVLQRYGDRDRIQALLRRHASRLTKDSPIAEFALSDDLGTSARIQNDTESAIRHHQRALEIARARYSDAGRRIPEYNNLGIVLRQAGRLEEAEAVYREALEWGDAQEPPRLLPIVRTNLVNVLRDQDRLDEAEAVTTWLLEESAERREPASGPLIQAHLANVFFTVRRDGLEAAPPVVQAMARAAVECAGHESPRNAIQTVLALGEVSRFLFRAGGDVELVAPLTNALLLQAEATASAPSCSPWPLYSLANGIQTGIPPAVVEEHHPTIERYVARAVGGARADDSRLPTYLLSLGLIRANLHGPDHAIEAWERALALIGDDPARAEMRQDLEDRLANARNAKGR